FLNAGKDDQLAVAVLHFGEQKRTPGLGHGLDDQDTGHDGESRKMPAEEGLVDANVLERHDLLLALNLQHPVDQQKRIAVRKNSLDLINVQRAGLGAALGYFSRIRVDSAFVHLFEARIIEDFAFALKYRRPVTLQTLLRSGGSCRSGRPTYPAILARRLVTFGTRRTQYFLIDSLPVPLGLFWGKDTGEDCLLFSRSIMTKTRRAKSKRSIESPVHTHGESQMKKVSPNDRNLKIHEIRLVSDLRIMHSKVNDLFQ